jgi:hypothetical protein
MSRHPAYRWAAGLPAAGALITVGWYRPGRIGRDELGWIEGVPPWWACLDDSSRAASPL